MNTEEAGLRARAVLSSEAAFRALQEPHRGRRAAPADLRRRYPNRVLAVPSARKARARSLSQYGMRLNVGWFF
jgi:hypothetical protein